LWYNSVTKKKYPTTQRVKEGKKMNIVIKGVKINFDEYKPFMLSDLLEAIKNHFNTSEYIQYVPEDPDNFYTNYVLVSVEAPKAEPIYEYQYYVTLSFKSDKFSYPSYPKLSQFMTDEEFIKMSRSKSEGYEKIESSKRERTNVR
jgi:hypothetical protein